MGYMSTWDNVKEIGRTSMFKAEDAKEEKVEIEMKAQGHLVCSPYGEEPDRGVVCP